MAERTGTQKDQESVVLNIHAAKVILALWVIAAGLVIASLVSQGIRFLFLDPRLRRLALLDLDAEGNIPTYFSTIILLFSSILLGTISRSKKLWKRQELSSSSKRCYCIYQCFIRIRSSGSDFANAEKVFFIKKRIL